MIKFSTTSTGSIWKTGLGGKNRKNFFFHFPSPYSGNGRWKISDLRAFTKGLVIIIIDKIKLRKVMEK